MRSSLTCKGGFKFISKNETLHLAPFLHLLEESLLRRRFGEREERFLGK